MRPSPEPQQATLAERLSALHERIARACPAGSPPVALVAVSKMQPPSAVRAAFAAGQRAFGENYVQEALEKMANLADLPLEWHFIGSLQSNKARTMAEHFDWFHAVDRVKIAQSLGQARPAGKAPLNVLIQVNISNEATKGGVAPGEANALATAVQPIAGVRLRGLMGMAAPTNDITEQRRQFKLLHDVFVDLKRQGLPLDTLSMGMSQDFEAALAEGATMLRIGSAVFGERPHKETV